MNARSKIGATEYKENVYAVGPRMMVMACLFFFSANLMTTLRLPQDFRCDQRE